MGLPLIVEPLQRRVRQVGTYRHVCVQVRSSMYLLLPYTYT